MRRLFVIAAVVFLVASAKAEKVYLNAAGSGALFTFDRDSLNHLTSGLQLNAAQETGGNLDIAGGGLAPCSSAWGGSGTLTAINCGLQALYTALQLGTKTAGGNNATNSVQTEPYTLGEIDHGGTTASASAITVLPASGTTSIREYMTALQLGRSDAGTTALTVACSDGTTTRTWVLPGNTGGQVINMTWPHPGLQWIANHIVTCTPSTGVTNFYAWGAGFAAQ